MTNSKRTSYARNDKIHAVRRIIQDGHCPNRVAADLDINSDQVHRWLRRYATPAEHAPSRLRLKSPSEELQELLRENETLKREREHFRNILGGIKRTTS